MLKTIIKYALLSITIWGLSACSSGRTIILNQEAANPITRPIVVAPEQRPRIKEEILLGNNVKRPSSETARPISVPSNNPRLGEVIDTEENLIVEEEVRLSRNEVIERMPFPTGEYKYLKKKGSSTVTGTVYLENSHTAYKVKGKKVKLWLNPVTSYSRQWYQESYLSGYKLSKTDKRLYNYLKFTYSDNNGKFSFYGVPAGNYYLTGTVSCGDECGFNKTKSLRLVREISAGSGTTKVDLMKNVP